MKGFCGVALSLLPEFVAARLARPLILAFSYDEEIGCVGAPAMIAAIGASLPPPSAVIVGEPTMMRVVNGHKGCSQFRTVVTRSEEHTSELQSLMRISYAVFCLKKKNKKQWQYKHIKSNNMITEQKTITAILHV